MVPRQHAWVLFSRVAAARHKAADADAHLLVRVRVVRICIADADDRPAMRRVVLAVLDLIAVVATVEPESDSTVVRWTTFKQPDRDRWARPTESEPSP